jgi:uncharacterized MAPEG superfamily protein
MPTSSLAGDRSHRARNPRDITGRRYAEQQREQEARQRAEEAGPVSVAAIRQEAVKRPHAEAFEAGAAWAFETIANAGVDVDAVLELDADEPGEGEGQ